MAKDIYHEIVKKALIKEGWAITHDPLTMPGIGANSFHIDLGAEKIIGAEKAGEKIAVEVKSFIGRSFAEDFHEALGKFLNYYIAMPTKHPDRVLYLAVPEMVYLAFFETHHIIKVREVLPLKIFTFDTDNQTIVKWIK